MEILIIRAGALGDTLMLMPSIMVLNKAYDIIIAGRKPGIEYVEPYVNQCIDMDRGGWHRLYSPGAVIDTHSFKPDCIIAFLNDTENIVGDNLNHVFSGSKIFIFQPFPDPDAKIHVALYMALCIQSSGILIDPFAAFDEANKRPLLQSTTGIRNKIALHPGSGSRKKNYSPDFWVNLSILLKEEYKSKEICFLIGPAEEDLVSLIERSTGGSGAVINDRHGKGELMNMLESAYLYIGHDSGVTHLAAMLGITTIALFKSSSIDQWRPLGPFVRVINPEENENRLLEKIMGEIGSC